MSYEIPGFKLGNRLCGSVSLAAKQYYGVKLHTDGTVILCSSSGEVPEGILQNNPAIGIAASIMVSGVSKCVAGAAINQGAKVMVHSDGKVRTATTGLAIIGTALEPSTADGDIIPVMLNITEGVV